MTPPHTPFVVATDDNLRHLDLCPMGLPVPEDARFNPLRRASRTFLDMLKRLDELTFGPEGMPMPRWIFVDAAELPGGIVGLAREAEQVPAKLRAELGAPASYRGLIPLSMYIAVPSHEEHVWIGHNLASAQKGLGGLTKAIGLAALRARAQVGVTQWDSGALFVHTRMGPLRLLSAWTPSHSEPWSLTYRADVDRDALLALARVEGASPRAREADLHIDSRDHAAMRELQGRIEAGERFWVAGPPRRDEAGWQRVPVASASAGG